jgi:hypothetical protein
MLPFQHLEVPIIWIDQICIDEANNREKAAQIPPMSRIYSGDTKAIMWLGLQLSDSNIAMDYLQRVYQQCAWIAYQLLAENGLPNVGQYPHLDFKLLGTLELENGHLNQQTAAAVQNSFHLPWFSRV